MQIITILFVLIVRSCYATGGAAFKTRRVSSDGQPIIWTSDAPTDSRVEFLGPTSLTLEMRCDFSSVTDWGRLLGKVVQFCFDYGDPFLRQCATIERNKAAKSLKIGAATVRLEFSPMKGAKAILEKIPLDQQLPLFYATCEERTEIGSIISNRLFVLDFRRNFPKEIWEPAESPQLDKNGSSTIKCLQQPLGITEKLNKSKGKWRQPVVPVTFEWFFCAKATRSECEKSRRPLRGLVPFSDWPVQIREDGELYSPFVPEKVAKQLKDKRLACFLMNNLTTFYKTPLEIITNDTDSSKAFRMVRPKGIENVTVMWSPDYRVTFPCHFDVPAGLSFKFVRKIESDGTPDKWELTEFSRLGYVDWLRKKGTFPSDTSDFRFPANLEEDFLKDTKYVCFGQMGNLTVSGAYRLFIIDPPRLQSQVKREIPAVHGRSVSIQCLFKDHYKITPGLAVCGKTINLKSNATVNASRSEINKRYKSLLPPVHFYVNRVAPNRSDVIEYTETNITFDPAYLAHSHFVTCVAHRGPFSNRGWIKVEVVPEKPAYKMECEVPSVCDRSCIFGCDISNQTALVFEELFSTKIIWFLQENLTNPDWGNSLSEEPEFHYFFPELATAKKRLTVSGQLVDKLDRVLFNATFSRVVRFEPWITRQHRDIIYHTFVGVILLCAIIGCIICVVLSKYQKESEEEEDHESRRRLTSV